eukprot:CAMPEP_0172895350 /NCGR_PEP_ID=MMETSP1075-20121228/152906_1 /TAXON_ID=2916 /ORGANISM="Ceratium fusus, Strain PA161109" /LENGTH=57 /DNA_ID=CAMNT_0013750549 /DNA_START=1 /DNA_END=174 /DNA_ORIENTATION=+
MSASSSTPLLTTTHGGPAVFVVLVVVGHTALELVLVVVGHAAMVMTSVTTICLIVKV